MGHLGLRMGSEGKVPEGSDLQANGAGLPKSGGELDGAGV